MLRVIAVCPSSVCFADEGSYIENRKTLQPELRIFNKLISVLRFFNNSIIGLFKIGGHLNSETYFSNALEQVAREKCPVHFGLVIELFL